MSENDEEIFEIYEENDLTENEDAEDNMIIIEDEDEDEENYFDELFDVNEKNDVYEGFNILEEYDADEENYVEEGYDVEENAVVISETDATENYEEIMEQNVEKESDKQDIAFPETYHVDEMISEDKRKKVIITLVDDDEKKDEKTFLDEYENYAIKDKYRLTVPAAKEHLKETPEDLKEVPEKVSEENDKRKKLEKAIKLFIKLKYIKKVREFDKPQQHAHKILDQNLKKIFDTFLKKFKKKISIDQAKTDQKRIEENKEHKVKRQSERYDLYDHLECNKARTSPYVKLKLKQCHTSAPPLNKINERREEFEEFLDWAHKRYGTKHERAERKRNTRQNLIGEELRQHMKKFDLKNFVSI